MFDNEWDFPCSGTFRGASFEIEGLPDPAESMYKTYPEPLASKKTAEPEWTMSQWNTIKQMRAEIKYLHKKLLEHIVKEDKPKAKPIVAIEL